MIVVVVPLKVFSTSRIIVVATTVVDMDDSMDAFKETTVATTVVDGVTVGAVATKTTVAKEKIVGTTIMVITTIIIKTILIIDPPFLPIHGPIKPPTTLMTMVSLVQFINIFYYK